MLLYFYMLRLYEDGIQRCHKTIEEKMKKMLLTEEKRLRAIQDLRSSLNIVIKVIFVKHSHTILRSFQYFDYEYVYSGS